MLFASIDLGGTNIAGALGQADGQLVVERKIATMAYEGPAGVLERIAGLVQEMAQVAGQRPQALSLGVPGLVDVAHGVTKFFPNLPTQWRDVPVRGILQAKLDCEIYLLNDVRAATLGELTYGHGKSAAGQTLAFFSLGTGVGGGVAIDGKLRLGPLGAAGELGHQTILADGPLCGCGNRGCLETLASGPAIAGDGVRLMLGGHAPRLSDLAQNNAALVTPAVMAQAAREGDKAVHAALVRAFEFVGIAAANTAVTLHPDLIVFGGGVAEIGSLLTDTVRNVLQARVGMFPAETIRVERSRLGDQAGVLGALALAAQGGAQAHETTPTGS